MRFQSDSRPVTDVTVDWVIAEFGLASALDVMECVDPQTGLFEVGYKRFRLVLEVVVDEPVIYL